MMNSRARSHGSSLALLVIAALLTLKSGEGYSASPFVEYHICMMNELKQETMTIQCWRTEENEASMKYSDSNSGTPMVIPAHNSYNWSFHPNLVGGTMYHCTAEWVSNGQRYRLPLYQAFLDKPSFVDGLCGGRHCIWKFANEGVYLYYIPAAMYRFMYKWLPGQM